MTIMEDAIFDELRHLRETLAKIEAYPEDENNWFRGYYMGQIRAYELVLALLDVQKKSFERGGTSIDS